MAHKVNTCWPNVNGAGKKERGANKNEMAIKFNVIHFPKCVVYY